MFLMLQSLNGDGRMSVFWVNVIWYLRNAFVHKYFFKLNFIVEVNNFDYSPVYVSCMIKLAVWN